jgi:hypothetical protein
MKKRKLSCRKHERAQTAVEYMILLGTVTAVILVSFNTIMPQGQQMTEGFYNKASNLILGAPPHVDPFWNDYP